MPKWSCKQCTTENAFAKSKCSSCGANKDGKLPAKLVKEQNNILSQAAKRTSITPNCTPTPPTPTVPNKRVKAAGKLNNGTITAETPSKSEEALHKRIQKQSSFDNAKEEPTLKKLRSERLASAPNSGEIDDEGDLLANASTDLFENESQSKPTQKTTRSTNSDSSGANTLSGPSSANDTFVSNIFSTAAGRPVTINKKSFDSAKKKHFLASDDKVEIPSESAGGSSILSSLFSTAAGNPVKISRKSLQEAEKKLATKETNENQTLSTETSTPATVELSLYSTASGRPVRVSAESMKKAKEIVNAEPTLFETGSGKPIKLTPEALQKGDEIFARLSQEHQVSNGEGNVKRSRSESAPGSSKVEEPSTKFTRPDIIKGNFVSPKIALTSKDTNRANPVIENLSSGTRKTFKPPTVLNRLSSGSSGSIAPKPSSSGLQPSDNNRSVHTSAASSSLKEINYSPSFEPSHSSVLGVVLGSHSTFHDCAEFEFPHHSITCAVTKRLLLGANEQTESGSLLLSGSEDLFLSARHYQKALVLLGADSRGCSEAWVKNTLTLSCWFASHLPLHHTPPLEDHSLYVPQHALSFLVHHYNSEYVRGERPALKKICEKDITSTSRMALFVVSIDASHHNSKSHTHSISIASHQSPRGVTGRATLSPSRKTHSPAATTKHHGTGGASGEATSSIDLKHPLSVAASAAISYIPSSSCSVGGTIYVSDGHYTVAASIDPPLMQMVSDRLLLVGSLIEVWGATSQTETAGSPLELGLQAPVLGIGFNGTKLHDPLLAIPNDAIPKLGLLPFTPQQFPSVLIRKIHPYGGVVPSIVGVVTRVLPPHFQEREVIGDSGGRCSFKSGDGVGRGPRYVRNLMAEEKRNDDIIAKMQKETERLLDNSGRSKTNGRNGTSAKTLEEREEVVASVRAKYARDVNMVCTVIIEEDTGSVAVVQQWIDGTASTFASMEGNVPKEGTRIRMYNLHPSKGARPSAPFHGKLLYARPTFNFLLCPASEEHEGNAVEKQLFAFERKVYNTLHQFEGGMSNTMVDICCMIVDIVKSSTSTVANADITTIIFCTATSNVFGSLEVISSAHLEITLPSPSPGTVVIIQNITFRNFDRNSGPNNVVRFAANEYTYIQQRPGNAKLAGEIATLENMKSLITPTLELGQSLLSQVANETGHMYNSYLVKAPHRGNDDGTHSPRFIAPSSVLLPANPVDAAECTGSELRQGQHSVSRGITSALLGSTTLISMEMGKSSATPCRSLFEGSAVAASSLNKPRMSVYAGSEMNDNDKANRPTDPVEPTRTTASPATDSDNGKNFSIESTFTAVAVPKRTKLFSPTSNDTSPPERVSDGSAVSVESIVQQRCAPIATERNFLPPPALSTNEKSVAHSSPVRHNTSNIILSPSPVANTQENAELFKTTFPVHKDQQWHQFGNFIPSTFNLRVGCGTVANLNHPIVDLSSTSYRARFRAPSAEDVDIFPFFNLDRNAVMSNGIDVSLISHFTNGFNTVSTVVDSGEAVASLFFEMVGPVGTLSSASALAAEHWYHLSVSRAAVLAQMESEEERWQALLLQSAVVTDDDLGLCLKEEEVLSVSADHSISVEGKGPPTATVTTTIDYPALGTMKRWNQAIYPDALNSVLWWHQDEWLSVQQAIYKGFSERLVKITVSESSAANRCEGNEGASMFGLQACFPIKENCSVASLL